MYLDWCSIGEVSYYFSMSSIKFQGHTTDNRRFESNFSKITRPVAVIKSLRFTLFVWELFDFDSNITKAFFPKGCCNKINTPVLHRKWLNADQLPSFLKQRSSILLFHTCILAPGEFNPLGTETTIFRDTLVNSLASGGFLCIFCEIAIKWMPQQHTDH